MKRLKEITFWSSDNVVLQQETKDRLTLIEKIISSILGILL
jgi:hypothetical protein